MKSTAPHPFRSEQARVEYHALYEERARTWPVPAESRWIESNSGITYCRVSGHPSDPPLILLPGSRGTSLTWIPNIATLSTHYRTYTLDSIYEFGLSVRKKRIKRPEDLIFWLDEVLPELIPEGSFRLMGLSYGGWLAALYSLHFPKRVRQLVLLSPAATVLPVALPIISRALLTLLPFGNFRKQFYYWLLRDAVKSGPAGQAYIDEAIEDWIVAERCFAQLPLISATVLKDEELQNLQVPTLFLIGENEKMYAAQKAVHRLNQVAPQIRTELFRKAGHDLWYVQADLMNQTILNFFDKP